MSVIDLMLTLPPTSVTCETTFSQMKLIKTSRRTRLQPSTLRDLLVVKLESPDVKAFNPEPAIDHWLVSTILLQLIFCCIQLHLPLTEFY